MCKYVESEVFVSHPLELLKEVVSHKPNLGANPASYITHL